MAKSKMPEEKKIKLIYSGELLFFSLVFIVLGILILTNVIVIKTVFKWIYNIGTLGGGCWVIFDFFWCLKSKKRRSKVAFIDKILLVPVALASIPFDIYCFVSGMDNPFYQRVIGIAFLYLAAVYIFQGIYHYKYPIPGLFDDLEEEKKKKLLEEQTKTEEVGKEENNDNV